MLGGAGADIAGRSATPARYVCSYHRHALIGPTEQPSSALISLCRVLLGVISAEKGCSESTLAKLPIGEGPSVLGESSGLGQAASGRRVRTVISLGANRRSCGPQKPVPRLV